MSKKRINKGNQGKTSACSRDVKLLAYCAMAGGALVAAQPANAAVVYSGVKNNAIPDNKTITLDLDGGGVVDFEFKNLVGSAYTHHSSTCFTFPSPSYHRICMPLPPWYGREDTNLLQLGKHPQNAIGGFRSLNFNLPNAQGQAQKNIPIGSSYFSHMGSFNLAAGTPIPNNNNPFWFWMDGNNNIINRDTILASKEKRIDSFAFPLSIGRFGYSPGQITSGPPNNIPGDMSSANVSIRGTFGNQPAGFLGVKFDMSGTTHYGWVRYQGTDEDNATTPTALTGTIIDWAYQDKPDTPIYAGQLPDCVDKDGDGYGKYCSKGPDCDDTNASRHDNCTCIDNDGDGYGLGNSCKGTDCNDNDSSIHANCPACTVNFFPRTLSKFISMMSPLNGIVISGQAGEGEPNFTKTTKIDWGTKNISTVLQVRVTKKIIVALVIINDKALTAGDSYAVRVGDCAGDLAVGRF